MLKGLKTFLQDRKTKKRLDRVLRLLYSDTRFQTDELINALNIKDEIDRLEYYVIINIAAQLKRPYTDDDISLIYEEQVEALENYVASKELRENTIELTKTQADLALLQFNARMDTLRRAFEYSKSSPGALMLNKLKAKGQPLTEDEEKDIRKQFDNKKSND
ncbi:hypothetical protein [Flavisolibacter ginsenosidimutans]|uniref:Uncharacterized protein n=1 Tax=Flavisolibacter ginsenosidimutans TaxID=661481 RepID=A0A5B8UGL9_9BACT|nr:hypothetical protein [Flavisolibacter ginsenosidimutans]QEC55250.1 hypothetical protein FSB75_04790 [Flavisolibacter ginsenosidimutans]